VAGKDIGDGVGYDPSNEQNWHAIQKQISTPDGTASGCLDVLTVPMLRPALLGHQTEIII